MKIEIKKYDHSKEYHKLLEIIKSEGEEWKDYFDSKYQEVLKQSITYVAYVDNELCGYSRSINDYGLYIWVIDLLVDKRFRGNSIGKKLMECLLTDYPGQDVFVMSDVDKYYKKLGYRKEGSIFKIEQ
ncbi:GNAT family N-acetyltransferase [Algoriphagus chordae]|uniref:Acetyltransferase (GNAT) family protein n=1 Tax=Algoriphagus chordae TaxID=237019 RepID=A0A2W7RHC7_9BACT|nr:GNAT family N-acetyltransferase [Algoriphagus chordae]PZX50165.1 acetyltransferase (GNAT) family protein [Algoriphagus chordae]